MGKDYTMKIIVLSGESNSGKTTMLKQLIAYLCDCGGWTIKQFPTCPLHSIVQSTSELRDLPKEKDATAVLERDGRKIGISTYGDDRNTIENKINFFKKEECECAVIGSHSNGSSMNYVKELQKIKSHKVIILNKVGIKGEKCDWKYEILCENSNRMSVNEIILHI